MLDQRWLDGSCGTGGGQEGVHSDGLMAGLTSIVAQPRMSQIGHLKTTRRQDRHHVIAVSFIRNDRYVAAVFLAIGWLCFTKIWHLAGVRRAGVPLSYSKMEV